MVRLSPQSSCFPDEPCAADEERHKFSHLLKAVHFAVSSNTSTCFTISCFQTCILFHDVHVMVILHYTYITTSVSLGLTL